MLLTVKINTLFSVYNLKAIWLIPLPCPDQVYLGLQLPAV